MNADLTLAIRRILSEPKTLNIAYSTDVSAAKGYASAKISNELVDATTDRIMEAVQQEIAKARIDELEKVAAVSRENVDRLPDEPDYPKNLAVKSAVDEYNKKSSEYIDAYFWFDMAFQPIHTYKRSRIAELSQTLKEHKEKL